MERIRYSMPEETLCRYCKHALDVNQTECKKAKQQRSKVNGFVVVVNCDKFETEAGE